MKKLLAIILLLIVLVVPAVAKINVPVNSVVSPLDLDTATKGFQGYLYRPLIAGVATKIEVWEFTDGAIKLQGGVKKANHIISSSDLGNADPVGLAVSPDGNKLYVATEGNLHLWTFSKDGKTKNEDAAGSAKLQFPRGVTVAPDGKRVYVADASGYIHIFDGTKDPAKYIGLVDTVNTFPQLFNVAVSPDNTMLAVSQRPSSGTGAVYIYSIGKDSKGAVTYTLKESLTSLPIPSYVKFAPDEKGKIRLYVRVHDTSASAWEIYVYDTTNFSTIFSSISMDKPNKIDTDNPYGEPLEISSNGQYLYATHFETSKGTLRSFVYNVYSSDASKWTKSETIPSSPAETILAPIDSIVAVPDGSILFITCSDGALAAVVPYLTSETGFGGKTLPAAPVIKHPVASDDLVNYSGLFEWNVVTGGTYVYSSYAIDVDTKKITHLTTWDAATKVDPKSKLETGKTYVFAVQANDKGVSGLSGPFAYSPATRLAKPQITGVKMKIGGVNKNVIGTYVAEYIEINGVGFGNDPGKRDTVTDNVKLDGKIIQDAVGPPADPKGHGVKSWGTTKIPVVIPRILTKDNGSYTVPGTSNLQVTRNGIIGNQYSFNIHPRLDSIDTTKGKGGAIIKLSGAGLSSSSSNKMEMSGFQDGVYFVEVGKDIVITTTVGGTPGPGGIIFPGFSYSGPNGTSAPLLLSTSTRGTSGDDLYARIPYDTNKGKYQVFVYINGKPSIIKQVEITEKVTAPTGVIIDDFEGTMGYTYSHFADAFSKTNTTLPSLVSTTSYNGTSKVGQAKYTSIDSSGSFGGGWNASLGATIKSVDISKGPKNNALKTIRYHVKGDGTKNDFYLEFTNGNNEKYRTPKQSLTNTSSWLTVDVDYTQMWNDKNSNNSIDAGETLFSSSNNKNITKYNVVYNGSASATSVHEFDDIEAIGPTTSGTPGVVVLTYNKASTKLGNKHWLSVKYKNNFKTIQDIVDTINGGAGKTGPVVQITRYSPYVSNHFENRAVLGTKWVGTNALVVTPEAYEITINKDAKWTPKSK